MKQIRIVGLHPGFNSVDQILKSLRFENAREFGFEFVWDETSPDYVFASETIYRFKSLYFKLLEYIKKGAISIFFGGEAINPDLNIFDYAISYTRNLSCDDRIVRLSTERFHSFSILDEYINIPIDDNIISNKTKFCNFMYSHPYKTRDELYYKISEYKKVDSLGKWLNNTGTRDTRFANDWLRISIEERLSYKFSIAAENACVPGYISEKLLSCLEAHTVPIYWGDPTISEEYNTKAFINCADYPNFDAVLDRVKEIDCDNELFLSILREPWHTEEQTDKIQKMDAQYDSWVLHIFNQDKENARRKPVGTQPDIYFYFCEKRFGKSFVSRIYEHLKK